MESFLLSPYIILIGSDRPIIAYQTEVIMIILNDLQGHSPISTIVNCDFSYSCAAVDKMSTDIAEFLVNV